MLLKYHNIAIAVYLLEFKEFKLQIPVRDFHITILILI